MSIINWVIFVILLGLSGLRIKTFKGGEFGGEGKCGGVRFVVFIAIFFSIKIAARRFNSKNCTHYLCRDIFFCFVFKHFLEQNARIKIYFLISKFYIFDFLHCIDPDLLIFQCNKFFFTVNGLLLQSFL